MAARKRVGLAENTRKRIQASMIVNRLTDHILAEEEIVDGEKVTKKLMTQSQVTAALGLLKKVLPDLTSVDMVAEINGEIDHNIKVTFVDGSESPE